MRFITFPFNLVMQIMDVPIRSTGCPYILLFSHEGAGVWDVVRRIRVRIVKVEDRKWIRGGEQGGIVRVRRERVEKVREGMQNSRSRTGEVKEGQQGGEAEVEKQERRNGRGEQRCGPSVRREHMVGKEEYGRVGKSMVRGSTGAQGSNG